MLVMQAIYTRQADIRDAREQVVIVARCMSLSCRQQIKSASSAEKHLAHSKRVWYGMVWYGMVGSNVPLDKL